MTNNKQAKSAVFRPQQYSYKKSLTMHSKHLVLSVLSAVALVAILSTGCKKSSNSSSGVSATVGGAGFSATLTTAVYSKDSAIYEIAGTTITTKDTSFIGLIITPPITLNKAISGNSFSLEYLHSGKDYFNVNGSYNGTGTLTVTGLDSVNHRISGTFSAIVYNAFSSSDSVAITNGQFNTSYQVVP